MAVEPIVLVYGSLEASDRLELAGCLKEAGNLVVVAGSLVVVAGNLEVVACSLEVAYYFDLDDNRKLPTGSLQADHSEQRMAVCLVVQVAVDPKAGDL